MNRRIVLCAVLTCAAFTAPLVLYALAQPPASSSQPPATVVIPQTGGDPRAQYTPPATVVIQRDDGSVVETPDGRTFRVAPGYGRPVVQYAPRTTTDGRTVYEVPMLQPQDAETLKLAAQEQAAAQEARTLAGQFAATDSEPAREETKKKLRDKLAAIFDLQQQRRAREVAQIEERLGKLKETMKKRDESKDPIIDRRLEQLTGGVDELGWEETGAYGGETGGYPSSPYGFVPAPPNVPAVGPRATPPATGAQPSPVPVPSRIPASP